MKALQDIRSLLFVPAHRPQRYAKALGSGADAACIDLEDAVPPEERGAARVALMAHLREAAPGTRAASGLRINRLGSRDGLRDLLALQESDAQPAFVMLAKSESPAQLQLLAEQLPGVPLIALIESVAGLQACAAIAGCHPAVQALLFGAADYSADARCSLQWEPLLWARSQLAAAAAQAGIGCLDVPWLDVADAAGAQAEAARVAALGFTGKALIHPSQVQPVHAGFAPAPAALAQARRIVEMAQARDQAQPQAGALLVDGRMIDRPLVLAAQQLLRRAAL
ncbi:MAG: CoA ester lyase [Rubrivivax sp.]|nr:CoA ester lyase [Rubrivivax sp.]